MQWLFFTLILSYLIICPIANCARSAFACSWKFRICIDWAFLTNACFGCVGKTASWTLHTGSRCIFILIPSRFTSIAYFTSFFRSKSPWSASDTFVVSRPETGRTRDANFNRHHLIKWICGSSGAWRAFLFPILGLIFPWNASFTISLSDFVVA